MKCDRCDNEATVHEVNIVAGKKTELHLCQSCALEMGLVVKPQAQIAELLAQMVKTPAPSAKTTTRDTLRCESCGMTFAEIRKKGQLGCSQCYDTFAQQLTPLLERAHEGATHHLGKVPRRAGGCIDREAQLLRFRRQLQEAVNAEDYERAAQLRDRLHNMENQVDITTTIGDKNSPEGATDGGAGRSARDTEVEGAEND